MNTKMLVHRSLAAVVSVALIGVPTAALAQTARKRSPQPPPRVRVAQLPAGTQRPTTEVKLSIGQGELVTLPANVDSVWTSNPGVADIYVNNPRQIHLFGKGDGEATVFATSASGAVIYATNVRVGQNLTSIDQMMKAAMPEADVHVTTVGQIAVLNGTVASPADSEQAQRLVTTLLNPGVDVSSPTAMLKFAVVNRLRTATPLQVNLQVRFAEVSRSFVKNVGVNLTSQDNSGGFLFGIGQGRQGTIVTDSTSGKTTFTFPSTPSAGTLLGAAGKLWGMNILSSLDLGETIGQVTTLANPNLTALSGETGTFLAGGEIPIPVSQGLGAVSVEFKQYGVSLAYTPTVLSDGRISLRVRPEVSQLSAAGAVMLDGVQIPALTTRRAETTVELGSGESFMIAGLLQNNHDNQITKAPGIGDMPILGALFRSNAFKRNESELVIVITPYLVKPVNANQIVLPTDGYRAPDDFSRILLGQLANGNNRTPDERPKPTMAPPTNAQPALGAAAIVPTVPEPEKKSAEQSVTAPPPAQPKKGKGNATPGFSLN